MAEPVVLYEVREHVATITMNRPDLANAEDTALIDGIDELFDRADADDEVRVVVLAGAGKHFSSGHDLKELVGDTEPNAWRRLRETPEGKFRHEQVMYFDRCTRIYSFRKPTIAAVQGACVAAGLMLACMCDLIVASDDATFQNPVLRMTGAAVELLVEPWELGIRKAKEFLWTGETIDAQEAWRLGLVNRVVPRAELEARVAELADRVALGSPGDRTGREGLAQPHRDPHGQGRFVEVPLHGPSLDAQHRNGRRSAGSAPREAVDGRGLRRAP